MDLNSIIRSDQVEKIQLVVNAKDLRDLLDGAMEFAKKEIKERDEPEYYTSKEMEALLHVTAATLIEYRKKGKLPEPVKVGRYTLYDKAEVHKAVKEGKLKVRQTIK